jgi:activator of HSP90 ATPase
MREVNVVGLNRRRVVTGGLVSLAGLAAWPAVAMGGDAEDKFTQLHQENDFKTTPARIYELLLDAKLFAAITGEPAEIRPEAGAAFSLFGARILGRNIELSPGERIVQAWKPGYWRPGIYSLVKFELKRKGAVTMVALDHWGFVEGKFKDFSSGWEEHYWGPIRKYLAS